MQNISMNIWNYEKRANFKLGEVSSLLISYNTTISWLYLPNGSQIIFLLRDRARQGLRYSLSYLNNLLPSFKDLFSICISTCSVVFSLCNVLYLNNQATRKYFFSINYFQLVLALKWRQSLFRLCCCYYCCFCLFHVQFSHLFFQMLRQRTEGRNAA